jgi:hypothetical protein
MDEDTKQSGSDIAQTGRPGSETTQAKPKAAPKAGTRAKRDVVIASPKARAQKPDAPPELVIEEVSAEFDPLGAAVRGEALSPGVAELEITTAAVMILTLLDGMATVAIGDYAKLSNTERAMIKPPLERLFKRWSASTIGVVNQYTDYVLVIMGIIAWYRRVGMERAARIEPPAKPHVEERQTTQERAEKSDVNPEAVPAPNDLTNQFFGALIPSPNIEPKEAI